MNKTGLQKKTWNDVRDILTGYNVFPTLRSETNFGNWKPFKNDEKRFLSHLKSSFCSQDI